MTPNFVKHTWLAVGVIAVVAHAVLLFVGVKLFVAAFHLLSVIDWACR